MEVFIEQLITIFGPAGAVLAITLLWMRELRARIAKAETEAQQWKTQHDQLLRDRISEQATMIQVLQATLDAAQVARTQNRGSDS